MAETKPATKKTKRTPKPGTLLTNILDYVEVNKLDQSASSIGDLITQLESDIVAEVTGR
jgi:hypothetical protein